MKFNISIKEFKNITKYRLQSYDISANLTKLSAFFHAGFVENPRFGGKNWDFSAIVLTQGKTLQVADITITRIFLAKVVSPINDEILAGKGFKTSKLPQIRINL